MPPKIIWSLWLQGAEVAPDLVKACLSSWGRLNPGWTLQILSEENLAVFLPEGMCLDPLLSKKISPTALSDVIRIELLSRFGGVWVDSTCYCLRPLDEWLPHAMTGDFFAFEKPAPDRMLSSWFLGAKPGSYIVSEWRRGVHQYWSDHDRVDDYFWFHRIFGEGYVSNTRFADLWDEVPKLSAHGPHYFGPYEEKLLGTCTPEDRLVVESARYPVLKLTHKIDHTAGIAGTVYRYLCDRELSSPIRWLNRANMERRERRVLLTWFGSVKHNGTIGDLLAVQSVATRLQARGYSVAHVTASAAFAIPGRRVTVDQAAEEYHDSLVFVCGPIIKNHPIVDAVINRIPARRKVGVSVSLFDRKHANYVQPFDTVLARQGGETKYEDVAILAPATATPRRERRKSEQLVVGLVLRGEQSEYGLENSLHDRTRSLVLSVVKGLAASYNVTIIEIENHLARADRPLAAIEADYARCDLILTSRFHGAIVALRNEVPFIAIDQIQGGAKVSDLLSTSRWPFVYVIDDVTDEQILGVATELVEEGHRDLLFEAASAVRSSADEALSALELVLESERSVAPRPSWRTLLLQGLAHWRRG